MGERGNVSFASGNNLDKLENLRKKGGKSKVCPMFLTNVCDIVSSSEPGVALTFLIDAI